MARTRVVIQSRLNSSRLPGKALMTIGGMPLIELVARRASRSGHEVIVATSEEHYDTRIADHLTKAGIPVMRGSLDDVLGRFVQATADMDEDDRVVRLTGDNPVMDADLVDELLRAMDASGDRYGRVDIEQVPEGLGAEAFFVSDLRRANATTNEPYDREHVTPWLRRNLGELLFAPVDNPGDPMRFRCTVDVLSDFDRVARLFADEPDPVAVSWSTLIAKLGTRLTDEGPTVPVRDRTAMRQSALVMGGAHLSGPHASAPPQVRAMLARAVDHGVTHVEVGRTDGNAEQILRSCGEPQLTQRLKFISRLAPMTAQHPTEARLAVEASLEHSFAELGRRSVAAALMPDVESARAGQQAGWRRLLDYRMSGEVGRVGVSVLHLEDVPVAAQLPELGYLELPFNILSGALPPAVTQLAENGVVILARSVFAGGRIPEGHLPQSATLARIAGELKRDGIADLATAYVLGHEAITSVTIGAMTEEHMRHNIALSARPPLTAEEIEFVTKELR